MKNFLLFSGSSNRDLAASVAGHLSVDLAQAELTRFADGESRPWVTDNVRDKTVFVLQSLSYPMDEHVMELALLGDAIRRSAPKTMIAVVPYLGYSRQDKQHRPGEPVSARVIAKFLEVSKFKEVITVDLHNDAIVGFFQIPVTHLTAMPVLAEEVKRLGLSNPVVVAPDVGGVKRARNFSYALDAPLIVMEKRRYLDIQDTTDHFQIIGDIKDKDAVIVDDMIASGSTIVSASQELQEAGARTVTVVATHGVLAGSATDKLQAAPCDNIIVSDTVAIPTAKQFPALRQASVSELLADAIAQVVS